MACLRCRVQPIAQDASGAVSVHMAGSIPVHLLPKEADVELRHVAMGPGAFLAVGPPPAGHGNPRICCLCSGVYYPRLPS